MTRIERVSKTSSALSQVVGAVGDVGAAVERTSCVRSLSIALDSMTDALLSQTTPVLKKTAQAEKLLAAIDEETTAVDVLSSECVARSLATICNTFASWVVSVLDLLLSLGRPEHGPDSIANRVELGSLARPGEPDSAFAWLSAVF